MLPSVIFNSFNSFRTTHSFNSFRTTRVEGIEGHIRAFAFNLLFLLNAFNSCKPIDASTLVVLNLSGEMGDTWVILEVGVNRAHCLQYLQAPNFSRIGRLSGLKARPTHYPPIPSLR